ncbi:MAG: carboxymuconolactone decarboxylase family protein [Methanocorpusculum sp.]|nr:carboxymuconolactone decarboxylase family protein [Methanocorpusculum sp.]
MNAKEKELEEKIGHVPVFFRELASSDPQMHEAVLKIDNYVWADGKISRKNKKLMAIAIASALRDDNALKAQLAGAKKLGLTIEEVDEALRVAFMLSGMPAYVHGKYAANETFKS